MTELGPRPFRLLALYVACWFPFLLTRVVMCLILYQFPRLQSSWNPSQFSAFYATWTFGTWVFFACKSFLCFVWYFLAKFGDVPNNQKLLHRTLALFALWVGTMGVGFAIVFSFFVDSFRRREATYFNLCYRVFWSYSSLWAFATLAAFGVFGARLWRKLLRVSQQKQELRGLKLVLIFTCLSFALRGLILLTMGSTIWGREHLTQGDLAILVHSIEFASVEIVPTAVILFMLLQRGIIMQRTVPVVALETPLLPVPRIRVSNLSSVSNGRISNMSNAARASPRTESPGGVGLP